MERTLGGPVWSRRTKALLAGLLFCSPWIAAFCVFQVYPIAKAFYYSLTAFNLLQPPQFIGLQNYQQLFHDPKFYLSLWNTVYITVFGLIPQLVFALAMALLLNTEVKGRSLYRTIYFLPTIVPIVASSLLWMWLFNPEHGLIDQVLSFLHLGRPAWLVDPLWTKPALILMGFWGTGTSTVMYIAALQDVPQMYYEAATIDGANGWRKLWHITLPAISPVTLFLLIMGLIYSFQTFTQAYIFTGGGGGENIGGPSNSLLFYAVYLFQQAFSFLQMGYASAMAWVLFIIVVVLAIIIFKTSARWVYYGGEK